MTVKTKYGEICGVSQEGYTVYKGIPFAKAPTGELRWKAPQPPEPWEGVFAADRFGGRSLQRPRQPGSFYYNEFAGGEEDDAPFSEDCLYLNIWTPDNSNGKKLPVAFYIHGGAFLGGSGCEKEFDGRKLARRGVVAVTINYRLGVWGFFAHPLLSAESENGVSGNYGLLDQIAALKWVRENIGAFGGDADNITVMGQSAGAMSTLALCASELTRGMIAKAVVQSGLGLGNTRLLKDAEADGLEFSRLSKAETVEKLRALSVEEVTAASGPIIMRGFKPGGELAYVPAVDGYVLRDMPEKLRAEGKAHHIPYIVGSNKNDMLTSPEALAKGDKGPMFRGVTEFASLVSGAQTEPVYAYYFTRQLPGDDAGAFHSAELWYTFGSLDSCWRPMSEGDHALSDRMMSYWVNFMRSGDPNGDDLPEWAPACGDNPHISVFDAE